MSDLVKLTIVEAKKALDKKEISATELTQAYIKEMQDKRNLNAYVEECADKALEQAKASDASMLPERPELWKESHSELKICFAPRGLKPRLVRIFWMDLSRNMNPA